MKWEKTRLLYLILAVAFLVRIIGITSEFTHGWHSSSGSIFAAAVRECYNKGYPQCLHITGDTGPVFVSLLFAVSKISGGIGWTLRIPMLIAGMISLIVSYKLFKRISSEKIALLSVFLMAFSPIHTHTSKTVIQEMLMFSLSLVSIYFLIKWTKSKKNKDFSLFCVFCLFSGLFKISGLLLFIVIRQNYGKTLKYKKKLSFLNKNRKNIILVGLLFGLGFTHHLTFVLICPALLFFLYFMAKMEKTALSKDFLSFTTFLM